MPLTPQDKAYWKDRLGWKAFVFLVLSTEIVGCVVWPILLYVMNQTSNPPGVWSWAITSGAIGSYFMLALLVSTIMWFAGQLFLWMDWLPRQR
jgi:hypothetical protein